MPTLVLTVISIMLVAIIGVASITYISPWTKEQAQVAPVVKDGALKLERAFLMYSKAHSGTAPAVDVGAPDGGLSSNLSSFLGFIPATGLSQHRWVYGMTDASAPLGYQNTAYFCLMPSSSAGSTEGKVRGILKAQTYLSDEQAFVNTACGATSNYLYTQFPAQAALTYFVRYAPGQI